MDPWIDRSADGVRRAALFAACVVHGIAGETAPARFGIVELATGLLLAVAVDWPRVLGLIDGRLAAGPGEDPAVLRIVWALHGLIWPPFLVALVAATPFADVVRDLVPLAFVGLALALPRGTDGARTARWLAAGLVFAGTAMASRAVTGIRMPGAGSTEPPPTWSGDLLLNDPSVAFAAGMLTVVALGGSRGRAAFAALGAAGLMGVLLAAGHRAGVVACLVTAVFASGRAPAGRRLVIGGVLLATALAAGLANGLMATLAGIVDKTVAVGLNARPEEFVAAVTAASDGPFGLALGQGWGARFVNPATGGEAVRFTHALASHLLLKAGLLGAAAGLAALAGVVALVARRGAGAGTSAVLAAWPVLAVAATVHTSHKFLTFGLVLAVIVCARAKSLESQP